MLGGAATLTGALFDTRVTNARISDPDDPTRAADALRSGREGRRARHQRLSHQDLGDHRKLHPPDDHITASGDPQSLGKLAPNTPHDAFNLWNTVEPTAAWTLGGGFTAVSHRYADTENTAGVPAYVVFNAMTSFEVNEHLKLQLTLNNVTNKLYFTAASTTSASRKTTPCRVPAAR